MSKRYYPFERIENFRDLGGYATPYGATSFDVIYRSGELYHASENDLEKLKKLKIASIIDFRDEGSALKRPDPLSFLGNPCYHQFSLPGGSRVPENREDMLNYYLEILNDFSLVREILLTIIALPKPLLLHCAIGKDRTGIFSELLLLLNGVDLHDVNADYLLSLPYLSEAAERGAGQVNKDVMYPDPAFFIDFLRLLLKPYNGSLDSYLSELRLEKGEIQTLKNLLGRQERSFGAVVFDEERRVLLEKMMLGHTSLPKGHIEEIDANDGKKTALREIKEETNLSIAFLSDKTYDIVYSPFSGVCKRASFYLTRVLNPCELIVDGQEVSSFYWAQKEEALNLLTYEDDKKVIRWAYQEKEKL